MSGVDTYLHDLTRHLRVRGRIRARFIHECRDHLRDSSAALGEHEAVRRFGSAERVAEGFDLEVLDRRTSRSALVAFAAVIGLGLSTVALVDAADPHASAVALWAVTFFAAAQAAVATVALAALQWCAQRRQAANAADHALLIRRTGWGLSFGLLTLFAAAGAVPGRGAVLPVGGGLALAATAAVLTLRARSFSRRLVSQAHIVRSPLVDFGVILGRRQPDLSPWALLAVTVALATPAAFIWDHQDFGTSSSSLTAACVEAALVVLGFVLLGPSLGLRPTRRTTGGAQ